MKNLLNYFVVLVVITLPRVVPAESQPYVTNTLPPVAESQKAVIGEVEDVVLLPWTVTLPARIDTGATISSLDARNLSVQNNIADFMLGNEYAGLRLKLPVVDWIHVRTSFGVEKRPVVQIGICLGSKPVRALASLRDRSRMTYPFLVGRNVLNGGFLVDTSRSRTTRPKCPSLSPGAEAASIN